MNRGIIGAVVAVLVILMIAAGSWYTVDQTERGVRLRYGAVIGTAQPGLGFKLPLIDSVEKVSVKTTTYSWDKMNSYSYDQQPADLKISVTLRASPDKVSDLYAKFARLAQWCGVLRCRPPDPPDLLAPLGARALDLLGARRHLGDRPHPALARAHDGRTTVGGAGEGDKVYSHGGHILSPGADRFGRARPAPEMRRPGGPRPEPSGPSGA